MTDRETPAAPTWTTDVWDGVIRETPAGAVEALAEPVERLLSHLRDLRDAAGDLPEARAYGVALRLAEEYLTAEPYSLTRSVDVERWQRIETAARDVDSLWSGEDGELIQWEVEAGEALEDLRDALGADPPEYGFEGRELTDSEQAAEDATWD